MRVVPSRARVVCFVLALIVVAPRALAQSDVDRATARALADQGQEALKQGDYAKAADLFGRAEALMPAPTLGLGFARAQAGLHKLVAAHETYNRIVREGAPAGSPAAFVKAVETARRERDALAARLPTVRITVTPDSAEVSIDGVSVPAAAIGVKRFVDPGEHNVSAKARGYLSIEKKIVAQEGATASVDLALVRDPGFPPFGGGEAAPVKAPESPKTKPEASPGDSKPEPAGTTGEDFGFSALGFGVGGLVWGTTGAVLALKHASDTSDRCPGGVCTDGDQTTANGKERLTTLSAVGFGTAVVGLGVGSYFVLSSEHTKRSTKAKLGWGLVGFGASGFALAATSGALALSADGQLKDSCPEGQCPASQHGNVTSLSTHKTLAFVGLGVGAVGLGSGLALVSTSPRGDSAPQLTRRRSPRVSLTPYVSAGQLGVVGRFE